jgi:hypothetical protein
MSTRDRDASQAGGENLAQSAQMKVRWDDSNMKSTYANVCNVAGTREEIVLLFGMNQAWHAGQKEVTVQLAERIVMSPFVAKRLALMLGNILKDYEAKYGKLDIGMPSEVQ